MTRQGKPETNFPPSNQDSEKLEGFKEDVTEQENELGAKNNIAGKEETLSLPSNPDENELEELKEAVTEQENKMGAKNKKPVKQILNFNHQTEMRRNRGVEKFCDGAGK